MMSSSPGMKDKLPSLITAGPVPEYCRPLTQHQTDPLVQITLPRIYPMVQQRKSIVTIRNSIKVAKTNLNTLIVRPTDSSFDIVDSFTMSKSIDFASIQQKIERQNPALLIERSNLIVLMQTKKEINAERFPS